MTSHEEHSASDSNATDRRRVFLTNGRDLYEIVEYSMNEGTNKEQNPILGATLEDCRTDKRTYMDNLSMLALTEVTIGSQKA
jgi:hypothetical protein